MMSKHADQQTKTFAIEAFEAGYSKSEIISHTHISRSTLDRLLQKSVEFQSGKSSLDPTLWKHSSGRPKAMTEDLKLQMRKVMEEEDEVEMEVLAWYIWEKLACLNGMCLRSVQQVVTDIRRERKEMAKTKSDANNNPG